MRETPGISVSLEALIRLRHHAIYTIAQGKKQGRPQLSGATLANIRGRGIEFDATREYQAGDDIRRMAWRVTARSFKPHVKMYHEEKERPMWLAVDLSPSMYFGTRRVFKSVCGIQQAALLGWTYLQNRERVGSVIATSKDTFIYPPQGRERGLVSILKTLADNSQLTPAFTDENALLQLLRTLQQQVSVGHTLFILSDFFKFETPHQKILAYLAERAYVHMLFIYDPLETLPPPPHRYGVTDGERTAIFNMTNAKARAKYVEQFHQKKMVLKDFAHKHHIVFKTFCTDQKLEDVGI